MATKLEWAGTVKHNFDFGPYKPWWPPFYATDFFLPKVHIVLTNKAEGVARGSIGVWIAKYDDDLASVTGANISWRDILHHEVTNWEPGTKRELTVRVPGRRLPVAGTYIISIRITEWHPQGTPHEELLRTLGEGNITGPQREQVIAVAQAQWESTGLDPHRAQPNVFRGEQIFDARLTEYFRIEGLSNLLTFWLVVGTFFLGFTALIPALTQLASFLWDHIRQIFQHSWIVPSVFRASP